MKYHKMRNNHTIYIK